MSQSSLVDVVKGPAESIGRYFSVLTVVPSAVTILYIQVLVGAQPWTGDPDWQGGYRFATSGGFSQALQLLVASLLLGLVLHPIQYALVQACEGYWGTSRVAQYLMSHRIRFHRRRRAELVTLADGSLTRLQEMSQSPIDPSGGPVDDDSVELLVRYEEAERVLLGYPDGVNNVRPTRLGNVLRRFEARAGSQYGLSLVTVAPHLVLTATEQRVAYLNDQRTALDLAIRMVVLNLLATAASVALLWRSGVWLAVGLIPYALAYIFYRGSIVVAAEYGTALTTVLELSRFDLYKSFNVPRPSSLSVELEQNARLMELLDRDRPAEGDLRMDFVVDDATEKKP